jgi:DNA-binding NarL/FixJ family response regulator
LVALDKGVRGYAHAYSVPSLLQELAVVVAHGGLWVGPDLMQRLVSSTTVALIKLPHATAPTAASAWSKLSAREVQVAKAVSQGRSNKEVAAMMFISERTVKAHLGAMFEKLGIRDRLQLVLHLAASGDAPSSSNKE